MESDLISVIVPVYGVKPYLRQCLDSVINQTYRELEIILIDDGSQDGCGEICEEYAAKDDRVTLIRKKNAGVSAARNDGIRLATGKWTAFVDSDDWLELDFYERLIEAVRGRRVDIFFSGGEIREYDKGCIYARRVVRDFESERNRDDQNWNVLLKKILGLSGESPELTKDGSFLNCKNNLYRSQFINKEECSFDTDLVFFEDSLFNYTVIDRSNHIAGCTYIGYHYRLTNAASATVVYQPATEKSVLSYLEKIDSYIPSASIGSHELEHAKDATALKCFFRCLGSSYLHKDNDKTYVECSKEIVKAKRDPFYYRAIWSSNNSDLPRTLVLLKYFLRSPGTIGVRVFYHLLMAYRRIQRRGKFLERKR